MILEKFLREKVNDNIRSQLESGQMPWQRPWVGWGNNLGFHRNLGSKKKYFGINFILLQMSAKKHGFKSQWWGTLHDFKVFGHQIAQKPSHIKEGEWATETVFYKINNLKVEASSEIVYNADQLTCPLMACAAKPKLKVDYDLAEKVLHNAPVEVKVNEDSKAFYYYPPVDYITMPSKAAFEMGLTGLPGYYDCLSHELMHYSEQKVGFNTEYEAVRELRAEIGAAMLMQELHLPHSTNFNNFRKWSTYWLNFLSFNPNLIFRIAASAAKGADYILSFSGLNEERTNVVSENVA